jgi:hypothetical protein
MIDAITESLYLFKNWELFLKISIHEMGEVMVSWKHPQYARWFICKDVSQE